jgi:ferredoxin
MSVRLEIGVGMIRVTLKQIGGSVHEISVDPRETVRQVLFRVGIPEKCKAYACKKGGECVCLDLLLQ